MDGIIGDCLKVFQITTITNAKKIEDYEYINIVDLHIRNYIQKQKFELLYLLLEEILIQACLQTVIIKLISDQ